MQMVSKKIKPMLPSLREKKRYLAFEVISKEKIKDNSAIYNTIYNAAYSFMGELGVSKAGMMMIQDKWNDDKQRGLIKVGHLHVDHLRAALTLIDKIEDQQVIVRSIGVSGILKKAEQRYLTAS